MAFKISRAAFLASLDKFIDQHIPKGCKQSRMIGDYIFTFSNAGWATEASVITDLGKHTNTPPNVKVGSSTHRTVVQAVAALVMYQQAVNFAAIMQNFMDEYEIDPTLV